MDNQYKMYFSARVFDIEEGLDNNHERIENGFIHAKSYAEAGKWADDWYGDELISIHFEALDDSPLFVTEEEAKAIMKRSAWEA